jgi:FtsZ-binding cell division protein ZapB
MDTNILQNLEEKIDRAVEIIANLKVDKAKLEKENESLRRQTEEFRNNIDVLKNSEASLVSRANLENGEIKARLEKLVGKLAALEDSWN